MIEVATSYIFVPTEMANVITLPVLYCAYATKVDLTLH